MMTFKKYLVTEMSVAVQQAAAEKNDDKFRTALLSDFYKAETQMKSGKGAVPGVRDIKINMPDEDHIWPYMTLVVDTDKQTKEVEVRVPDLTGDELDKIKDFDIIVNGKKHKFATTTDVEQKRTGSIAAGVAYLVYGVKQATTGGRSTRTGTEETLSKISDEALRKELEKRGIKL